MNPLQQAAKRRKIWYFAAILALFTLSMLWRGEIRIPLALREYTSVSQWLDARSILNQSKRLDLRELDQGDPEVAGSVARLGLVGSRGLVVTLLWYDAIEQQKRNDFHKLELRVKVVTALQPHFITPWIFQSWNIAYNVSVEMQSLGDMYFYIARGIELLAEGERRNSRSPDMRYQIAFYYQNKFGVADQVQTLRCLFQLSCMPPGERDPKLLQTAEGGPVDLKALLQFCEKHPHLVRRLRGEERRDLDKKSTLESLQIRTPEDLVEFLKVNQKVPSRYKNATDLAPDDQQFPVLPKRAEEIADEASPKEVVDDAFSGYLAARAWFAAANTLVPPNKTDASGRPVPCGPPGPGDYDQFRYRVPRLPMLIIFRQGPARAQTYQAELMEKDGWFDGEGWKADEHSDVENAWFTEEVAWFTLTELSLDKLRKKTPGVVPEVVLSRLKPLKDKRLQLANFKSRLAKLLSDEEMDKFFTNILNDAEKTTRRRKLAWFTLTELSLDKLRGLPEVVLSRLKPLKDKELLQANFESELAELLSDEEMDKFLSPILNLSRKREVILGAGTEWARVAWTKAAQMWRELGEKTGMILDQSRKEQFYADADVRSEDSPLVTYLPEPTPEQRANEKIMKQRDAITALFFYRQHRQLTNFPHYLGTAEGEQLPETIQARKLLWKANQARRVSRTPEAVRLYEEGLKLWKDVLLKNPSFHRPERSDRIEEETYEVELEYLNLLIVSRDKRVWDRGQEEYAKTVERIGAFFPLIGTATQLPSAAQFDWNRIIAEKYFAPFAGMMPSDLPPGDSRAGGPWIRQDARTTILGRMGLSTPQQPPGAPPRPGGGSASPPAPTPK
jgi:hypothetical protein